MPPLVFDGKHFGNDPIWTPEQHLQQTTPVVSANVDGPSVFPKQMPKKIPKIVNTTTTSPPPQITTITATPQMPISILATSPEECEQNPEMVEPVNDNIFMEIKEDEDQYVKNESPVQINQELAPIETGIDEITEGIDKMSVETETTTTSEFIVSNTNENIPVNQTEVEEETQEEVQNAEPEEVIAEFTNDTEAQQQQEQLLSFAIPTEKSVDNDGNKKETNEKQPKLLRSIDETDRMLPVEMSHRPEHVQRDFKLLMEKYDGYLAVNPAKDTAIPNIDDKNYYAVVPTYMHVIGLNKQQPETQDPESEDDDADKENNIQNKKCLQEVSLPTLFCICMVSTTSCNVRRTHTFTHTRHDNNIFYVVRGQVLMTFNTIEKNSVGFMISTRNMTMT